MLAGGAGTRFWPASRRAEPKPFVPLFEGRTLFQATLERLSALAPPERTWVVSARPLEAATRRALRGCGRVRLLLEPAARNTAAAIVWAAARIAARDPEALLAVFPADHHIPNAQAFVRTLRSAARVAARGEHLVLIGIQPSAPDTAYGYIQLGERVHGAAHAVKRFVEKPSAARARRYQSSGNYLWNAGIVVARAGRLLDTRIRTTPTWRRRWHP